jgi:hypothetical protein
LLRRRFGGECWRLRGGGREGRLIAEREELEVETRMMAERAARRMEEIETVYFLEAVMTDRVEALDSIFVQQLSSTNTKNLS